MSSPSYESAGGAGAAEQPSDREVVNIRVLHAPRERVFRAWTEPEHLARWWGPKGFRNTFQEFDPRPGGRWSFVMHAPNGGDFANEVVFEELVEPERIVLRHLGPVHEFRLTATLAEEAGGTRLTFCMRFETAAECAKAKSYVVEANEQNLDRLEAELARMG